MREYRKEKELIRTQILKDSLIRVNAENGLERIFANPTEKSL